MLHGAVPVRRSPPDQPSGGRSPRYPASAPPGRKPCGGRRCGQSPAAPEFGRWRYSLPPCLPAPGPVPAVPGAAVPPPQPQVPSPGPSRREAAGRTAHRSRRPYPPAGSRPVPGMPSPPGGQRPWRTATPRWQSSRCSSRSAAPASVQGAAILVHRITAGSAHRTAASGRSSQDSGSSVRAGIIQSASHSAPPGPAGLPGIGASGRRRGRSPPAGGGKFCPPPTWEGPAAPLF